MKKVCIYCEKWGSGGIESFIVNTLEHMDRTSIKIDIVVACIISDLFINRLNDMQISIHELSGQTCDFFGNYRKFCDELKTKKYDVVHINAYVATTSLFAVAAQQRGVKKVIIHSHNSNLRKSWLRPLKLVVHNICKHSLMYCATDFWACSRKAEEFMFPKSVNNKEVAIVPNGIDTERFAFNEQIRTQERKRLGVTGKIVIGNIGRISDQKNQEFLIDIFESIHRKAEDTVLLVIGDGDIGELKAKVTLAGITDEVIFYGPSSHVESLLNAMDIFVFPSKFEGFGIVAVEAQCNGLNTFCSSAVPGDVSITSLCHKIPLTLNAAEWAEHILNSNIRINRDGYAKQVKESGYDIVQTSKWIQCEYTT